MEKESKKKQRLNILSDIEANSNSDNSKNSDSFLGKAPKIPTARKGQEKGALQLFRILRLQFFQKDGGSNNSDRAPKIPNFLNTSIKPLSQIPDMGI